MKKFFKHFCCRMRYTLKHLNQNFEIIPKAINNSVDKRVKFVTLLLGMIIATIYHVYVNGLFDLTYIVSSCTSFAILFVFMGDKETINSYSNNWRERYRIPVRYFIIALFTLPFSIWFNNGLVHLKSSIHISDIFDFFKYIVTVIVSLPLYVVVVSPIIFGVLGMSFLLLNLAIILAKKTFKNIKN